MAIHTPTFSGVRICNPQRIFQGSSARHTSISADHTASHVSQGIEVDTLWSRLLTSLKTPIHNRGMFVDTGTGYEIHKSFCQWFALYPWYDSGGDCKNRQGRDRKVYENSDPSVRQSKQSESERNLAQGNSNSIYREFRGAIIHHDIDITQIN
jgi:hypothetical protein